MMIMTLILMLVVIAVVIYGVRLALAGDWKNLIIVAISLILVLWVLQSFGITIPSF